LRLGCAGAWCSIPMPPACCDPATRSLPAAGIVPCKTTAMLVDNMRIVQTLVEGISAVPVAHMVNISSDAIYADGPVPLTEETPAAPTSLHGAMHLAREVALRSEPRVPIAMLRPTLIYGAADPHNGYGPNRFRRLAAAGEEIVLFGEGEERRDHVAVGDVADIAIRVLKHGSRGALNVASGEVHSFRSVAEMAVALVASPVPIKSSPRTGPMPHNGYRPFDVSATMTAFPDFRYTPLPEGLRLAAAG
jgi:UDP-glucose 4-epimerase